MKVDVYNMENKRVDEVELTDKVFKVKWNPVLVHQAVVAMEANRRESLAHTKDRSEVRGGGKKPWRQKGTGRARAGGSRSPLWKGGGITFGPRKEKNFSKKINKKMKRLALFSVLSRKLKEEEIKVVDGFRMTDFKTKNLFKLLKSFLGKPVSLLIVSETKNKNLFLASRNLPKVGITDFKSLNVHDCLSAKHIFFEKEAIRKLADFYKV